MQKDRGSDVLAAVRWPTGRRRSVGRAEGTGFRAAQPGWGLRLATMTLLVLAAAPAHGWIQTLDDGPNLDFDGNDVVIDAGGDVLVAGRMFLPSQQFRFAVVKLDGATGDEIWRYETGGSSNGLQEANALTVDGSGDVLAIGIVANAPNTRTLTIVKLNGATGAELWSHQPSVIPGSEEAHDIAVDASGDVAAAGEVDRDFYVVKLNGSTGAVEWDRKIDGSGGLDSDRATQVEFDASGNVVAGGELFDGVDTNWEIYEFDASTGADLWHFTLADAYPVRDLVLDAGGDVIAVGDQSLELTVVKLSGATGGSLWQHNPGIGRSDANGVAVDASGDVFVVGSDDLPFDFVVEKLSGVTGAILWQVVRDGTATNGDVDVALAVAVGAAGDVFVGGQLDSDTSRKDAVVLRMDGVTGSETWIQRLDGSQSQEDTGVFRDRVTALTLDPAGDVVAIGEFEEKNGSQDFLAVKLDEADGAMAGLFGTKLLVKDKTPSSRSITFLLKSDYIQSPPPGTPHDPRTAGGTVRIWNPTTLEEATFALPAGPNWQPIGTPAGAKGYRYKDKTGLGPCKSVTVLRNKKLKVTCKAKFGPIPFTLDEASQGSLAVSVQMGAAAPQCAEFGGLVLVDEPGQFKAKAAAPAAACP